MRGDPSRRRWLVLGVAAMLVMALALAVAVAACGSSSGGGGGSASVGTGTPVKGGTFIATKQADPQYLDPALDFEGPGWAMEHLVFNCLVGYAPAPGAAGLKLVPDLATELPTPTNDGLTYTFHIKPGVKFAPPVNREVTAEDFVYSFNRMMNLSAAPAKGYYEFIKGATAVEKGKATTVSGIKALGKYTLEIDLVKPNAGLLMYMMAMPFTAAVPKEWVDKYGDQFSRHVLGTGPYYLASWTPGTEIDFKRNTNYTGPPAYPDEIKIQLSVTASTAVLKLESGQADVLMDYIPPADYVQVSTNPTWSKQVAQAPAIWLDYLFINHNVKPFDNLQVRQAVEYAINRDKIVKLLSGIADPLAQIYPAGMPGHVDGFTGGYSYDPAKAKQLLAAAGYANGFTTALMSHNVDPWPKVLQSIQNDLAQVGIKANIKTLNEDAYWTLIGKPTAVGIGLNDWSMDYLDPSDYVISLFSKSSAVNEGTNPSFWWSPTVEAELKQAQGMSDPAQRIALFSTMQEQIMADAAAVPLYQNKWLTMFSKRIGGGYISQAWIFDMAHYWINQ
jgi:ABC-type transport system substrate-binding protein